MLSPPALMWTQIATGFFVFLAANAAYGIWLQKKKMRGGGRWPVVLGEILVSQVEIAGTHASDEDSDCTANIRYRYKVGTKSYEGHRIRFGGQAHSTRRQAEELTAQYP